MRVWIDVSNSPQVPFFRPLIALLCGRGHDVDVTTREFAQTIELLSLHGIEHEVVGPGHGGAGAAGEGSLDGRSAPGAATLRTAREFDIALSHASHELPMVARSLGVPSSYAFDYEFARVQHGLGCRAATRVVVPEAIPQSRLDRLGARASKMRRYPGLKEEYYLARVRADRFRAGRSGIERDRVARRRPHTTRRVAVPPSRQSALRGRTRAARGRLRSTPSSSRARTSSERRYEDASCRHS